MPGEESLRLILEDETGEEQEYELIGTFAFEDRDYMGLLPVEKPEEGVLILGFHPGKEDEVLLDPIEDEEEYQRAAEAFEDIFNQRIPMDTFEEQEEFETGEFEPEEFEPEEFEPEEFELEDFDEEFDIEEIENETIEEKGNE